MKRKFSSEMNLFPEFQEEGEFTKYTPKELKSVLDVPLICGCRTQNGKICNSKPKFKNNLTPSVWRCGMHLHQSKAKNTMQNREGSWRYAICMSLHVANTTCDTHAIERDTCYYCKKCLDKSINKNVKTSIDHIFPLISSGQPTQKMIECSQNKIVCCSSCNSNKGNKDAITWCESQNIDDQTIDDLKHRISMIPSFSTDIFTNIIKPKFYIATSIISKIATWVSEPGNDENLKKQLLYDIVNIINEC